MFLHLQNATPDSNVGTVLTVNHFSAPAICNTLKTLSDLELKLKSGEQYVQKAGRGVQERKAGDSELCFLNHWPDRMIEGIFAKTEWNSDK